MSDDGGGQPVADSSTPQDGNAQGDGNAGSDGASDGTTPNDGVSPSDGNGSDTGPEDGGDAASSDAADSTSPGDASDSASPVDAADSASPDASLPTLTCVEPGSAIRTKIATLLRQTGGGNEGASVSLFNVSSPTHTSFRVASPEQPSSGPTTYHVYTFGGGSPISDTPVPVGTNGGNPQRVQRYPGGIAAVVLNNYADAGIGAPELDLYTLSDSASTWSAPIVAIPSSTGVLPNCTNNVEAVLWPMNPSANDFLIELSYTDCSSPPVFQHTVVRTNGGSPISWPLPPLYPEDGGADDGGDASAAAAKFDLGGIIATGSATAGSVFALTNPSGNGGPNPGIGTALFTAEQVSLGTVSARELPLISSQDLMISLAIGASPNTGLVEMGFLEAQLSSTTLLPQIYVGQVTPSKMATLDPAADLRATTFSGVSALPINGASLHWDSFGSPNTSDNLVAGSAVYPSNNGMNLVWWDASGSLRAMNAGTTALFPTLPILGADAVLSNAPFPTIASFQVVYAQVDPEASTYFDLVTTTLNCTP